MRLDTNALVSTTPRVMESAVHFVFRIRPTTAHEMPQEEVCG
jgi:hypothetical protein